MSTVSVRGKSRPDILRITALDTTGRSRLIRGISHHLEVREVTANPVRIFFSEEDFDADENYVQIAVGETWQAPISAKALWLKASAATSGVVLVAYV